MSIYTDLKQYAGKITTRKHTSEPYILDVRSPVAPDDITLARGASATEVTVGTIEHVIENILPPLVPLKDGNGYVYDSGTVAAVCPAGHIHKYFINDVLLISPRCTTCSKGNKFTNLVRVTAEETLRVPFVVSDKQYTTHSSIEYINPVMKIVLACSKWPKGNEESSTVDGNTIVCFHPTTSQKKIRDTLCDALRDHQHITAISQCSTIAPKKQEGKQRSTRHKANLPYTAELATVSANQPVVIINDDTMRLENC